MTMAVQCPGSTPVAELSAHEKVEAIRAQVIEAASLPLPQAITLPRAAYLDEDYFRHEVETVLETGWLCLAHVSQLKEAESFLALDLLGEPLLVTRDKSGAIRVLSRVCAHRAMDIMPEGFDYPRAGAGKVLTCPYHRWTYDLDGRLRGCAHMQRSENFSKADWRLGEFRSEIWHGFVFVNFDGKASPLAEQYAEFSKLIAPWRAEEMEVAIALQWDCAFNWKAMIENWMESYHHIGIHSTTLNPSMPGQNTWTEPEHPHFIRAHLPFNERLAGEVARANESGARLPGFRPVAGLSIADQTEWGLYIGHPCFMFLTMRDRILWYRLLPISAERCKLETMVLVTREALDDRDSAAIIAAEAKMLRDFHNEDMTVNTAVQRGLRSRTAVRGRLSHLEEPVWLIQRYLAARAQGTYPLKADRAPYNGPLAASAIEAVIP
jgi:phenylpropionate dioxygenase-like ring-hydroxylating dioxygenase large terminal subunit